MGQEKPVTAWYLLAEGTIEEWVHELVEEKRQVVDRATDGTSDQDAGAAGAVSENPTSTVEDELLRRLLNGKR